MVVKTGDDGNTLSESERSDYYPFSSSESALLYILLNSPRPVVSTQLARLYIGVYKNYMMYTSTSRMSSPVTLQSERILKYFFHVLKQINPFIPSFTQVKSIVLPGYTPPSKVSACMKHS